MPRLSAEFYTEDTKTKGRKKAFSWAIPADLSLDEAKAAAKERAVAAGYVVTAANFRRDPNTGGTAAIVIYMEKKNV